MAPRSLSFRLSLPLLLLALSVPGCTTVTTASPPADDRPQAVRGPLVPEQPTPPLPAGQPVTPPSARTALVRTEPDGTRRPAQRHERRAQAPADRTTSPGKRPERHSPRVRPAPQQQGTPRTRPRPPVRPSTGQKPPVRPRPETRPGREEMRELCRRADGVASSGVVSLCRETWG
ncbi:hypothetical protein [Streptomyces griseosporeus]|uniref:hypothetical protein n=1 Tax=Streptomyces griseosporeus TaxID=1910 RepID=UPI00167E886C|nr:hypothetical protein [Streptomyces griseosporeus]